MNKTFSIVKYEYKMQIKHPATWGIFLAALILAMLDNFPSAGNLARLEFLNQPSYFTYRIMGIDSLLLLFGLMFLASGRIYMDKRRTIKPLLMSTPISKEQYVWGKALGGILFMFSLVSILLFLCTSIYLVFVPDKNQFTDYLLPFVKTLLFVGLPASLFVGACAVTLPVLMDIRLFYFIFSAPFIINAFTVGSAGPMPFYMITSGDLMKLIWQHPRYPFSDMASIYANLAFLLGCGLLSVFLLMLKRRFWRSE